MTRRTVLISGGGIAGPALAYWLHRWGFGVTVVERAAGPRPGGQAVDLRGAARTVVERMGLLDEVRAVSLDQKGIAWVRPDGRIAARMPSHSFGGEGIVSEIEVLRGDLARVLSDATAATVEHLFDDTVTALDQDGEGVTVAFERSAPRRFDLVVGADGPRSAVRTLALDPQQRCLRPLGLCTSWFTVPAELDLDGWFLMYNEPGGLVATVRPGRVPGEHKAGLSFRVGADAVLPRDVPGQKRLVAERFAGAGWEVPRLLGGMAAAADFAFAELAQVRLDGWSRGRIALVGDAAWSPTPLSGLGTSLAVVGAYVLAGELAAADGDPGTAFRRYEQVLRSYVDGAQELPPGGAAGFAPTRALDLRLRTVSLRMMTRWPLKQLLAGQFDKAGAIDLPDYAGGGVARSAGQSSRA
jgi:2-polyprenyl-6-methoxyphenol hydroxylase-like FAD-dependent oxidoreductase